MRSKYQKEVTNATIRDAFIEVNDEQAIVLTIEFNNGEKEKYPLSGKNSKAVAVVRLFSILEVKRSTELIGMPIRLLRIKKDDKNWQTMGIGHHTKDRFMPCHRGDCVCDAEWLTEKIVLGKTW